MIMCLSCRWKEIKWSFWGKKRCFFFSHYLADDFLYWLQPYAQSLLWTAGVQQKDPLVSSLWSLNGLCKPQEAKGGVSCGVQLQNHVFVHVHLGHCAFGWSVFAVHVPGGQVLNVKPDSAGCSSLSIRPRERTEGEKMTGLLVWTCTGCTTLYGIKCSSWPEGTETHTQTHTHADGKCLL